LDQQLQQVQALIHNSGLPWADAVVNWLSPSMRLISHRVRMDDLEVGASRIGGLPDLPAGSSWPERAGVPLSLIAQIRLSEAAPHDVEHALPDEGILSFFYDSDAIGFHFDPTDRERWHVRLDKQSQLTRITPPAHLPSQSLFAPCAITWSIEWTLPPFESHFLEDKELTGESMFDPATRIPSAEDEGYGYSDLMERVAAVYGRSSIVNRLLGHPDPIQGDMQLECQLMSEGLYHSRSGHGLDEATATTQESAARRWRLLLQVDCGPAADMTWGDVGRLYYWIREEDLRERHFDATWLVMQCT
jgi:uncharacterized protein YwqG